MKDGVFAYVPHDLRVTAFQLGWMWRGTLPPPHGVYADYWEHRCCCGRPAVHPRAARRAS